MGGKNILKENELLLYCCQENCVLPSLKSPVITSASRRLFYILEQISNNYFGSIFIIPIFDSYHFHQHLLFPVPKACFAISIAFLCGQYDFFPSAQPAVTMGPGEPLNSTIHTRNNIRTGTLLYTQWLCQFLAIQTLTASTQLGIFSILMSPHPKLMYDLFRGFHIDGRKNAEPCSSSCKRALSYCFFSSKSTVPY